MHIKVYSGTVECDFDSKFQWDLLSALHMQQRKQTIVNQFIDNYNVWDRGTASHKQCNVWMPQNALHHDLVLNFSKQLISYVRVEDFLDRDWSAV